MIRFTLHQVYLMSNSFMRSDIPQEIVDLSYKNIQLRTLILHSPLSSVISEIKCCIYSNRSGRVFAIHFSRILLYISLIHNFAYLGNIISFVIHYVIVLIVWLVFILAGNSILTSLSGISAQTLENSFAIYLKTYKELYWNQY
jgi:hypothetical protein